jgi:tetratricopeptide (TPR) repeat protein
MQLTNYQDAIADYNRSISIRPSHKALADRGFAFLKLKSYQSAIDDFTQALDIYPNDYYLFYYRGLAYKGLGKKEEACSDFRSCVNLGYLKAQDEQKDVCP